MFKKLRNRIIVIAMSAITVVLVLAGVLIVFFSSTMRPEPKPHFEPIGVSAEQQLYNNQELQAFIKDDREAGNTRLLITLLCVGAAVEIAGFLIVYYMSQKIVAPVKAAYDKQKLFIANASHELKTPLAVIGANVEALDVSEENRKWKGNIENEIEYANKLVLNLLQLARMDAGTIKTSVPENINLCAEISNRVELFRPKFSGKITAKLSEDAASYSLPKQDFIQVLDILLDNATKYADQKISIVLEKNKFNITNDGATISEKEREKIFDRFYQVDKTKSGSGLGLAIAKAICAGNGWDIHCEGTKNTTKFVVILKK